MNKSLGLDRPLWDLNDLCSFLKVEKQTVYNWVLVRKIPYYKVGKFLRFNPDLIADWVEKGCVQVGQL